MSSPRRLLKDAAKDSGKKPETLLKDYLQKGRVMQLATVAEGRPWVCTVYYVADDDMNLYWLSSPTRRHSREIAAHNNVAITIPVKFDQPVIGVQAEGTATVVTEPNHVETIIKQYIAKYDVGRDFYENFIANKNQHLMYRFTPQAFVLFDEVHFPGNGRQEIAV